MADADVFVLPASAVPEPDSDTPPGRAQCQMPGCENTVTKPARGRSPKYCDEHRGTRSAGSSETKLPNWPNAATVEDALKRYFSTLSFTITLVNPEDGRIIAEGGDAVAVALVNLGRKDKQWRKWLERAAAPGKYGELIVALGFGIVVPVMANHGLLPQFRIPDITTANGKEGT